jgi:hypothetical protein
MDPDPDPQLYFVRKMCAVSQVLNFSVAYDSVLHGLGGYFECTLYKDIMLSILPATHSPGNPVLAIRMMAQELVLSV